MYAIGSIIGDICGSSYEFQNKGPVEYVELFRPGSKFTDDTVLTCAVADWLASENQNTYTRETLVNYIKRYANTYKNAGYGGMFRKWLEADRSDDYQSFGNGSAMRVAPVGYIATSMDDCLKKAEITAKTTHGHPEGIKGAKAIATAIFLARKGLNKDGIKENLENLFDYDLDKELTQIGRHVHKFDATCQVTVPEALICFLKSESFDDCIRKSIEIGGDTDTIACMSGGIAEAYYGVPAYMIEDAKILMDNNLINALVKFSAKVDELSVFGGIPSFKF